MRSFLTLLAAAMGLLAIVLAARVFADGFLAIPVYWALVLAGPLGVAAFGIGLLLVLTAKVK